MINEVFKVLAVCIVAAALCVVIRAKNAEYAFFITIAAGIGITLLVLRKIAVPITVLREKLEEYGVESEYFKVALKAVGIGYITSFTADACRDSGQTSLAAKAELAGKCAIFLLSLPLIISVLETAIGFTA